MSIAIAIASSIAGGAIPYAPLLVPGCVFWGQNGVGMATGSWTDSSGAGHTVTAGNAPTLVTNQIAGLSVLRGTKAGNTNMASATGCPGGNVAHTIFVVARFNTPAEAPQGGLVGYGAATAGYGSSTIGLDGSQHYWYGGSNNINPHTVATADGNFHVFAKRFDAVNINGYVDGLSVITPAGATMALGTGIDLFTYAVSASISASSDIAEVLIYNSSLSIPQFTMINRGLGAKFGLAQP